MVDLSAALCGCCIDWIGIIPSYMQWVGTGLGILPQLTGIVDWIGNIPNMLTGGK